MIVFRHSLPLLGGCLLAATGPLLSARADFSGTLRAAQSEAAEGFRSTQPAAIDDVRVADWRRDPVLTRAIGLTRAAARTDSVARLDADPATTAFLLRQLDDPTAAVWWLDQFTVHDHAWETAALWQLLQQQRPDTAPAEAWGKVAFACALLFDHDLAEERDRVEQDTKESKDLPPARAAWVVGSDTAAHLLACFDHHFDRHEADHRVSVLDWTLADLLHLLHPEVSAEEMQWAYTTERFTAVPQLHRRVAYVNPRSYRNQPNVNYDHTLPCYRRYGGMCGQQARFVVAVARSHGFPAFRLRGDGHVWFAFRESPDTPWKVRLGKPKEESIDHHAWSTAESRFLRHRDLAAQLRWDAAPPAAELDRRFLSGLAGVLHAAGRPANAESLWVAAARRDLLHYVDLEKALHSLEQRQPTPDEWTAFQQVLAGSSLPEESPFGHWPDQLMQWREQVRVDHLSGLDSSAAIFAALGRERVGYAEAGEWDQWLWTFTHQREQTKKDPHLKPRFVAGIQQGFSQVASPVSWKKLLWMTGNLWQSVPPAEAADFFVAGLGSIQRVVKDLPADQQKRETRDLCNKVNWQVAKFGRVPGGRAIAAELTARQSRLSPALHPALGQLIERLETRDPEEVATQ